MMTTYDRTPIRPAPPDKTSDEYRVWFYETSRTFVAILADQIQEHIGATDFIMLLAYVAGRTGGVYLGEALNQEPDSVDEISSKLSGMFEFGKKEGFDLLVAMTRDRTLQ